MNIFDCNMAATTQLPKGNIINDLSLAEKHVGNCGAKAKIFLALVSILPIMFG